ncbi:MAG: glycosyltransferase [Desulfuromonadaceae bacterium]
MYFSIFVKGGCGWALTNVSVNLVSGLALNGHQVDLVVVSESAEKLREFYREVEGFEGVNIVTLGRSNTSLCLFRLAKYLRSTSPDVLFSQLAICNVVALFARHLAAVATKNVFLEGTIISNVGLVDAKENLKLKIIPLLVRWLYPGAQAIIGKSPDVLEDLKAVLGKSGDRVPMKFLPNPYSLVRYRRLAGEAVEFPWSGEKDLPFIVAVGRLSAAKAFDVLIRAFAEVCGRIESRLLILGEGPLREELETLANELGVGDRVFLPGSVRNPWKYMVHAEVFVLSSRWEGWPSALCEAMSVGMAVITTDCPGGGKVMVEHGRSGLISAVNDVDKLRDSILELLANDSLRRTLGQGALARSEHYDYRHIDYEYVDFVRNL